MGRWFPSLNLDSLTERFEMKPSEHRFPLKVRLNRLSKRRGFRTAKRLFWAFCALAVVIIVAIIANPRNRNGESEDTEHVAEAELDSFERVVNFGNPEEVIGFIEQNKKKLSNELPIQIENLNNRLQLATRLAEISVSSKHQQVSIQTTVESRLALLQIYQQNKLPTRTELRSLEHYIEKLDNLEPGSLQNTVDTAGFFLQMEKLRSSELKLDQLKTTIQKFAEQDQDNHDLANRLASVLDYYSLLQVEVSDLLVEICDAYGESTNPLVLKLVGKINKAFYRRKYKLLPLTVGEQEFVKSTITERVDIAKGIIASIQTNSPLLAT